MTGQLWSIATTQVNVAFKVELNTILFAKTLLRKDVATSSSSITQNPDGGEDDGEAPAPLSAEASTAIRPEEPVTTTQGQNGEGDAEPATEKKAGEDEDFSSKSQIMTLMTTDVS